MENDALLIRKVIGYTRVSTKKGKEDGLSIKAQEASIRAFASWANLDLVAVISDVGRSGESLRRKGIQEVLRRIDAEGLELVVAKLDRVTRDVGDWAGLVKGRFGRVGGPRLESVADPVDLSTPYGRLFANLIISFSQCELETGVVRSEVVMGAKRVQGHQVGALLYGKALAEDGKTVVDDEAECRTIKAIFTLRKGGLTYRAIASELDVMLVPSRNGQPWSHSTIAKILARVNAEGLRKEDWELDEHGYPTGNGVESQTGIITVLDINDGN